MLKKFIILTIFGSLFIPTLFCFAQDPLQNIANNAGYKTEGVTEYSFSETVGTYIKGILVILGVIFFVLTFYAGFLWLTANGDESKVDTAKKIITGATIGLIIIVISYGITSFVLTNIQKTAQLQKIGK